MVVNSSHVQRVHPTRGRQLALYSLPSGQPLPAWTKQGQHVNSSSHVFLSFTPSQSGPMWSEWCEGNYVTTVIIKTIHNPGTNLSTFHRWEHWTLTQIIQQWCHLCLIGGFDDGHSKTSKFMSEWMFLFLFCACH